MGTEAVELYRQMPQDLVDEVTNVCILNACSHAGLVDKARSIFGNIPNKTESIVGAMVRNKSLCDVHFNDICQIDLDRLFLSSIFLRRSTNID